MIAASTYLPRAISSTIAASSIHGTGAQNLVSALRSGCRDVSGSAFGPNFSVRWRTSSLESPAGSGAFLTGAEAMIHTYFVSSLRIDFNSWRLFGVVLGYAIFRSLSVSRTIRETIKRAFSLSSAGTTYQGA